ncbi:MAG: hypothetical protein IPM38_11355 [Ignavibacteria bacterium]|nr:hypothetical protein [Ignavibacteria bacterium]
MPEVKINQKYDFPIVIDEQKLYRLYDEISNMLDNGKISFILSYTDKSSLSDITIEDVINDENSKNRRIYKLKIIAKDKDQEIELLFGTKKTIKDQETYVADIILNITGVDKQNAYIIQSKIEERLKTFKPFYPRINFLYFAFSILFFTYSFICGKQLFYIYFSDDYTKQHPSFTVLFVLILFVLTLIGILFIYLLFPQITFLIGDGIERHNNLTKLRSKLFWVVFVSFLFTVVGAFLSKLLSP